MDRQKELVFSKILDDNKYSIYKICKIYAVSPIEPQDLFQEVVLQIWKSLPNFKEKSSIKTWIYKITLNVCTRKNSRLTKERMESISLESIEFKLSELPDDVDLQEKYKALYDCISYLEVTDKKIILLYLEELRYKEISKITDLSENHIAVKMKRVRAKLLKCITPKIK